MRSALTWSLCSDTACYQAIACTAPWQVLQHIMLRPEAQWTDIHYRCAVREVARALATSEEDRLRLRGELFRTVGNLSPEALLAEPWHPVHSEAHLEAYALDATTRPQARVDLTALPAHPAYERRSGTHCTASTAQQSTYSICLLLQREHACVNMLCSSRLPPCQPCVAPCSQPRSGCTPCCAGTW
jgi:hypothetical protein